MALHASLRTTWTESLDSWAMSRIGAEIGKEELPAVGAMNSNRAKVLSEQKGWIGNRGYEGKGGSSDVGVGTQWTWEGSTWGPVPNGKKNVKGKVVESASRLFSEVLLRLLASRSIFGHRSRMMC